MVDNIKAAGFKTEDFDTVLLTHMHPDHACGITAPDGTAVFPNATVWADKDDADFWLSKEAEGKLPQDQRVFVKMSQNAVAPYLERGRFKVFNNGDAIVPGISIVPSAGHTPGHTSYMLTSAADKMLIWGDIIHFHAVQLPHPEVSIEVDIDAKRAIESRQRILAEAAKNDWMIGGAHLPFPGMGHVRAEKTGYSWTPIEYAPLPGLLK
jgi:glyoxylase-like metal-dependent hydrolase (beta-lactamase superfamily II)